MMMGGKSLDKDHHQTIIDRRSTKNEKKNLTTKNFEQTQIGVLISLENTTTQEKKNIRTKRNVRKYTGTIYVICMYFSVLGAVH